MVSILQPRCYNSRKFWTDDLPVKALEEVYTLPGMLTYDEVDCLYRLGQMNHCNGVIVEIGS